jgi:hypothetical protein
VAPPVFKTYPAGFPRFANGPLALLHGAQTGLGERHDRVDPCAGSGHHSETQQRSFKRFRQAFC